MKKYVKKIASLFFSKKYNLPLPPPWEFQPPTGFRLEDVRTLNDLARHADAWNELFNHGDCVSPLLSYPWISAFFKHKVTSPEEWLCLFAYRDEQLIGVLPLVTGYSVNIMGVALKLFKLPYCLGNTFGVDCLTLPGHENILGTFVDYLKKNPSARPVLSFKFVKEYHATAKYFSSGKTTGMQVIQKPAGFANVIPIPPSHTDYAATLSSHFKKYLRKNDRHLAEHRDVKFIFGDTDHSPLENVSRFIEVEHANWKGKHHSSIKDDPANTALFTDAAIGFSQQDMMRFNFAEADGKTIAGQYAIRSGRTLYVLKIGFDQEYSACSPGNLLRHKQIEHHIEDGAIDNLDLMSDIPNHENWKLNKIPLFHIIALPDMPVLSSILKYVINYGHIHEFSSKR